MANIFIQISTTTDGYIEGEGGDLSWFVDDPSFNDLASQTLGAIDGMVFGRKAHAAIAEFWIDAARDSKADADLARQAKLMRDLPKYVLTRGGKIAAWENSRAIGVDELARVKSAAKRPIAVFAGAATARAVLAAGLVDELQLITYPVLLGKGTPLFEPGETPKHTLALRDSQTSKSGAILRRYEVKP